MTITESLTQLAADVRRNPTEDSLIAALKQAHDALVHAGFYIACASPSVPEADLLGLRQAVEACRAALDGAEADQHLTGENAAKAVEKFHRDHPDFKAPEDV